MAHLALRLFLCAVCLSPVGFAGVRAITASPVLLSKKKSFKKSFKFICFPKQNHAFSTEEEGGPTATYSLLQRVLKMFFGTDLELILNTVAKIISKIISAMCLCIWVLDFSWILLACRFPEGCFFKRFV